MRSHAMTALFQTFAGRATGRRRQAWPQGRSIFHVEVAIRETVGARQYHRCQVFCRNNLFLL